MQVSQSEPTVRHAVHALGALHEERFLRRRSDLQAIDTTSVQTSFPCSQYSKALHGLQALLKADNTSIDVVLMCALLFTHFEALRESFVSALVHLKNAIQVMLSSSASNAKKVDLRLVRAMMRLDIQGSMYLGMRVPGLPFYTAAIDTKLPASFHDLTQARDVLNTWTLRLFHFMRVEADGYRFREPGNLPLEVIAKSHELAQTFVELDKLLWDYMHKPTAKLTIREQHGLAVLRARVKIDRILSACCIYCEDTMLDAFLDEFEEILTICAYIMSSDDADRRLFSVSLDEGLLQPLFFVVTGCRDSQIRRQALKLLQKLPRKMNIWHVEAMTRTAQLCVEFEEALCDKEYPTCKDIPEWRRVYSAGFDSWDLENLQKKVTSHLRTRPNGMDGEWADVQKVIEW